MNISLLPPRTSKFLGDFFEKIDSLLPLDLVASGGHWDPRILTVCSFCWNRSLESVLLASLQETFSISCQCPSAWSNGHHQFLQSSYHLQLRLLMGFIKVLQGILMDLWPCCDPKVFHQVFLHRKVDGDFFVLIWHTELLLVLGREKHSFWLLTDAGEGCIGILRSLFHVVLDRKRYNTHLYLFWYLICSFTSLCSVKLPSVVIQIFLYLN